MQIFSKGKKEKWMAARSINRSSEMATKQGKVNIRDRYKLVYDKKYMSKFSLTQCLWLLPFHKNSYRNAFIDATKILLEALISTELSIQEIGQRMITGLVLKQRILVEVSFELKTNLYFPLFYSRIEKAKSFPFTTIF